MFAAGFRGIATMPEAGLKNWFRRVILWAGLLAILLLIVFSIYGAFIGAESAKGFFNSIRYPVNLGNSAVSPAALF
jgi:hypothetical protein